MMKRIGILTTHDSVNYGAELQALALQTALTRLGHDAYVIDRRRDAKNSPLRPLFPESAVRRFWRLMTLGGGWIDRLRCRRAQDFMAKRLRMTDYHFHDWSQAPAEMGLDVIMAGSDQIWNPSINDVRNYLPGRAPKGPVWMTYAASMGVAALTPEQQEIFRAALPEVKAISVREKGSCYILKELGFKADPVVDPVVLLTPCDWRELFSVPDSESGHLVVYSLGIDATESLCRLLSDDAVRRGRIVDLFTGGFEFQPTRLLRNIRYWFRLNRYPGVKLHLTAGPEEFVAAIAGAGSVITNSFHALVFAALFARNVRYVISHHNKVQHAAMVRIHDFADGLITGPLLAESLSEALFSLATGAETRVDLQELGTRRMASLKWLETVCKELI